MNKLSFASASSWAELLGPFSIDMS